MPRKSRKQPGTQGGAYANRTDLTSGTQAVAVPTGLPYGERQALVQAQQQTPLPQTAGTPQGQAQDPAIAAAAAHDFQPTPLNAPSKRPHEPIQHGLASGPGGGPEVLGHSDTTAGQLQQLAQSTGNPTLLAMAQRAAQYQI